jgi:CBS domain-containing protein
MTFPLIVLAILATVSGFVGLPEVFSEHHSLNEFLHTAVTNFGAHHMEHNTELMLMGLSVGLVSVMIGLAYARTKTPNFVANTGLAKVLENKWYVDEFYDAVVVNPLVKFSGFLDRIIERKGIDGGVNGEVSFILRNMGVSSSVSGSYLFKGPSIGHALLNLTSRSIESNYLIEDFMIPFDESPVISKSELSLKELLITIEEGNMGFCMVVDEEGKLEGIVSSADIRKGLIRKFDSISELNPIDLINVDPIKIGSDQSVIDLLQKIKKTAFPVMYLPVVDKQNILVGSLQFVHLIKGEI